MKTRIIKATLAVAFIAVAGYTAYNSQKEVELSDLAMANVEALASGEGSGSCRWKRVFDSSGCVYHVCVLNGDGNSCTCGATQG